ncbi:MAG: nitrous oxide reductase family maturation protein NosD, partial [Candidatus Thorarchaeota archaeon]
TRSDHNNISENFASGSNNGIFFEDECYNNNILENYFNENQEGIYLYYSDFNHVLGNTANDNDYLGIGLEASNNNTISGNNANNNTNYGISLDEQSNNNTISRNMVNSNKDIGIYFELNCDNNDITDNTLYNNTLGINFESDCDNNSNYKNFFVKNGKHASDDGTDNTWNSTTIGNYWDNHTGPDISPEDGIVDNPYTYIDGSAGSIDYLPIAEDGPPMISINSPKGGERFGSIAPSFNVEIIDLYVLRMWYTIDGGLHNYTFTENGTINQDAWDALPKGTVTITFFARDVVENEAFESVKVIKSVSSGQEPDLTIIIILVSIIGGLVIIGAILILLVRKGKISLEKIKGFSFRRK